MRVETLTSEKTEADQRAAYLAGTVDIQKVHMYNVQVHTKLTEHTCMCMSYVHVYIYILSPPGGGSGARERG